jgi:hypothetical protein
LPYSEGQTPDREANDKHMSGERRKVRAVNRVLGLPEGLRNYDEGDDKNQTVYEDSEVSEIQNIIIPFLRTRKSSPEPVQVEFHFEKIGNPVE